MISLLEDINKASFLPQLGKKDQTQLHLHAIDKNIRVFYMNVQFYSQAIVTLLQ